MFKIERMKKFDALAKDPFEIFREIDARWVQEVLLFIATQVLIVYLFAFSSCP